MMRALILGAALLALSGCVAIAPAALFVIDAFSTAATVTETTCRTGEVLTTSDPGMLDGHPRLQAAEKACEALAP